MFLTCLLNSSPPTFKRNSFEILFHCFAAKYLKEFNPYFVVFTFGSDSVTSLFTDILSNFLDIIMNGRSLKRLAISFPDIGIDET